MIGNIKSGLIFLLTFLFFVPSLYGQQEVTFSQYMFNHQSLNPGYVGAKDYNHFTLLHRSQWVSFSGAPESQAFTFHHKMTPKNFGFGISGINDKIGPVSSSRVAVDLAYHLPMKAAFLSLGIKAGIHNFNFDQSIIQTTVPNDLSFNFNERESMTPNIGFGLYYHRSRWYVGLSIPWFIEGGSLNAERHLYAMAGGLISITQGLQIKPSLLLKKAKAIPTGYDLSTLLLFKELFWIGPQIRSTIESQIPNNDFGGGFGVIAGVHLNKSISLGYSYNTSALGNAPSLNHATHELMMRFDLIPALKASLRSPRIF
jgi:type IX secretion system PorP/SprF family membrane protein